MLPDDLLEDVAYLFSLLSDPTRLRLVRDLHETGEQPVGKLAARAGTTLANASQHLVRLSHGGLVLRRRVGKNVLYRVEDPRVEQLCEIMCARVQERGPVESPGAS
jgi:DNA-binding transcriptional ArsR family regulator